MSFLRKFPSSGTATITVSHPYRVSDMGCIHVTISVAGCADIGAWVSCRNGPRGCDLNVEAVDACDESHPRISTIYEIIARHGVSLADAIKADADLTRFRADVARRIADEEAAFRAEIARLAADKRQTTNL